jgi:hypothetical protein
MRRVIFASLLILIAAAGNAQHQNAKSLMVAWEKSWNTYDLDEVQRLFVNDSSVTYFSSERAGLIHGIDSLVKHHKGFGFVSGGKTSPNKLWLSGIRYLPAAVTATWHFQRPGNPEQRGPVTFILHRDAKGLRIAHAHFSNDPKAR